MDLYIQLVLCTAGTVLYLFLLTLFAGLRRRRAFHVVLFLTGIAVFLVFSGRLLELNARIHYDIPPAFTTYAVWGMVLLGGLTLSPLLVHVHAAYLGLLDEGRKRRWLSLLVAFFYALPIVLFGIEWAMGENLRLDWAGLAWIASSFLFCGVMEAWFARRTKDRSMVRLHVALAVLFLVMFALVWKWPFTNPVWQALLLMPGALLGYYVVRNRFLLHGIQRNLVFTVTAAFLALLYLTLVQRVSEWLEPSFPPIATRSILLFLLVVFFEPLQRGVARVLQQAFRREAEKLQGLIAEIQQVARAGNLEELVAFAEGRIRETLGLVHVRLVLKDGPPRPAGVSGNTQRFVLRNGPLEAGVLEAFHYGAYLSGETRAALEFLAEQLPAAADLARLLEEKVRLERELAERERLALLGQMAASISHNLKNPLSSMKTLLQVQLENRDLPDVVRKDCALAVAEVDRLMSKLSQLLQFAKPTVRSADAAGGAGVSATQVAEQVVALLKHDAERRGVCLELSAGAEDARVAASEPAVHDILSNLVVNALEASRAGGRVEIALQPEASQLRIHVTDDGPGIRPELQERVFLPFFTTKPSGIGLGLAIVTRRLEELGGSITVASPVEGGRGVRFTVVLPVL